MLLNTTPSIESMLKNNTNTDIFAPIKQLIDYYGLEFMKIGIIIFVIIIIIKKIKKL